MIGRIAAIAAWSSSRVVAIMPNDLGLFLIGVVVLVTYLAWSALTEMGTRWPWHDRIDE